jgi:hypothetical protein
MKRLLLVFVFPLVVSTVHSHDDNESRIKFWKEYYNPKVEVTSREVPTIDISLIKNNPFYQIKTTVENLISHQKKIWKIIYRPRAMANFL